MGRRAIELCKRWTAAGGRSNIRAVEDSIRRRLAELDRENASLRRAISLLHRIANLVRASLELEATCYAVLHGVTAGVGLGLNRAMIFLVDEHDRSVLRGYAAVGPSDGVEADRVWRAIAAEDADLETLYEAGLRRRADPGDLDRHARDLSIPVEGDSPIALALRRARPVRAEGSDDVGGLLHLQTAIAAPMRGRSGVRGVLYADNRFTWQPIDAVGELVFSMVADHAGRAIETAWRYERVARAARTDALTGLGHHGTLMQALGDAIERARASERELAVAMIDLDDFKKVNDTLGHLAGDALLAGVAERLQTEVRSTATAYRYGGEEFAVVMPDVGAGDMLAIGERLRRAVGERPFQTIDARPIAVTCSIGLAALDPTIADATALLTAADTALLRAKLGGKNRVEAGQQESARTSEPGPQRLRRDPDAEAGSDRPPS